MTTGPGTDVRDGAPAAARREVDPRLVVYAAALAAGLLRFPGLLYPLGSDESGFTLVARAWHPEPDRLYGSYWVDRPPTLIALIRLSDWVGGAYFIRIVAAVGCVVLVVLAAATARAALRFAGETDPRFVSRTGAWTAVLAAAFTSTSMIDPIMAKGEILGIPWVMLSFFLALRALTRERIDARAYLLAAAAGLAAVLAQGLKQNLVSGVVFGGVLLVGARLTHRITPSEFLRLAVAALVGAAVPVLGTVAWALQEGVHLQTVWYAVYGFRSDAIDVITSGSAARPLMRALLLLGIAIASGAAFVLAGVVLHWRRIWRLDRTLSTATALIVLVDGFSLLVGGSFWRPYLFVLVPDLVLCTALLLAVRQHVATRARILVVAAATVSVLATAAWTVADIAGFAGSDGTRTGVALREAAEPGDTIVVYGGHAEVVETSGMSSPYEHLWSLPMRTLDPDLDELRGILSGPDAPTWVVMWVPPSGWGGNGEALQPILDERYRPHGQTCGDHQVYLLAGESRPPLDLDCVRRSPFEAP
jgi:hypothetical protein